MSTDVVNASVTVGGSVAAGFSAVANVLATTLGTGTSQTAFVTVLPMFVFGYLAYRQWSIAESRSSRPETGVQSE